MPSLSRHSPIQVWANILTVTYSGFKIRSITNDLTAVSAELVIQDFRNSEANGSGRNQAGPAMKSARDRIQYRELGAGVFRLA